MRRKRHKKTPPATTPAQAIIEQSNPITNPFEVAFKSTFITCENADGIIVLFNELLTIIGDDSLRERLLFWVLADPTGKSKLQRFAQAKPLELLNFFFRIPAAVWNARMQDAQGYPHTIFGYLFFDDENAAMLRKIAETHPEE